MKDFAKRFKDVAGRVLFVLRHYPETRSNNNLLVRKHWELYGDDEEVESILRARRKWQNTLGLYKPIPEVQENRNQMELEYYQEFRRRDRIAREEL